MEFTASNNQLRGPISNEIGRAAVLERLVLSNNQLTGTLPTEIGNVSSLSVLILSSNLLEGNIPPELGRCTGLTTLELGNNQLSGSIPAELAQLSQLQCLDNRLNGGVDKLFSNTMAWRIEKMNLSNNLFDGELPHSLGELGRNRLEGPIPKSGICRNLSEKSLAGNKKLCGRSKNLDCHAKSFDKSALLNAWGVAAVVVGSALVFIVAAYAVVRWIARSSRHDPEEAEESRLSSFMEHNLYFLSSSSRSKEPLSINVAMFQQPLPQAYFS
ncbi:hypothetical protein DVH24_022578 [Malus domestica]|uniref:Leucine-rich repeat-containing N-terminal plant-type domain-containing protein n=1 Tax=Malus domestica TaxID=3750 RepID=A0A498KPS1_MALDO|nr:hypothetical protein DVH24_022578 [Malus domestica]